MQKVAKISLADALVRILKKEGIKFIFGHPGEQILPLYQSLRTSSIKHILMRHEQGAAHAADGYARASFQPGVCAASAGPGALNLVMGVAAAYKDSVPLLVITGDVPRNLKYQNVFQDVDINAVFEPVTLESHLIKDPVEGVRILKKALFILKNGKTGPIHLNFPRDVLQEEVDESLLDEQVKVAIKTDWADFKQVEDLLEKSKKPLILAGAGVLWSNAIEDMRIFAEKHQIPVATTYPARGVINEEHPLSMGLLGIRGTPAANFAGKNSDLILALGCRLSERTIGGLSEKTQDFLSKRTPKGLSGPRHGPENLPVIHVNLDSDVLKGTLNIQADVKDFLVKISEISAQNTEKWLEELQKYDKVHKIRTDFDDIPLKPQKAIKEILDNIGDSTLVNDAGSHTTWVNLLMNVSEPSSMIFSGGFGPMGYGIPASVGVSLARPNRKVVVVVGDGGFQMTVQELATIAELDLPIIICLINNQSLGIIRQWQELYYDGSFQVKLENPDFLKLAHAYHIKAKIAAAPGEVEDAMHGALKLNKPVLIEIIVDENEDIPLPK
ncbi:MAG: thiamine pyrophosphate-binding protein [Methanobacteriaceae archaeon]|nr:thiamine pyrophosphate-binding protein [Methanobacteriaceae archaeon]